MGQVEPWLCITCLFSDFVFSDGKKAEVLEKLTMQIHFWHKLVSFHEHPVG
jgi:hypothetical protein